MRHISLAASGMVACLALGMGFAVAGAPGPDDRHGKRPEAFSVNLAGKCGGPVEVRWSWRAMGNGTTYDVFEVMVDGRHWLTPDQEAKARQAMEALHRRKMVFAGGRIRCRSDAPVGTIELFQEPALDARAQERLLIVMDDRRQGLLFWPTSGPPVDAFEFVVQ